MAASSSKIGKAGDQHVTNADKQNQNLGMPKSHTPVGKSAGQAVHKATIPAQAQACDAKSAKSSSAQKSRSHVPAKEEAKIDRTKSSPGSVTVEKDQKVAEDSSAPESKATGEWGDIYDNISDDDDEEAADDDEEDDFDDAARPGQTATQYGWL